MRLEDVTPVGRVRKSAARTLRVRARRYAQLAQVGHAVDRLRALFCFHESWQQQPSHHCGQRNADKNHEARDADSRDGQTTPRKSAATVVDFYQSNDAKD